MPRLIQNDCSTSLIKVLWKFYGLVTERVASTSVQQVSCIVILLKKLFFLMRC